MKMSENLIKKVKLLSDQSSAQNRGERLKRVRNLSNLSRKEFCDLCEININTLKGWEIGRYGGLPRDGAVKIIEAVKTKNIHSDLNWLLHGEGSEPIIENINNQQLIISEINLFEKLVNTKILSCQILDDAMAPQYNQNNWVTGRILDLDNLEEFINKICIVKFDNNILVRKIGRSKKKGCYNLFCTNFSANTDLIIENINISAVSVIERIYIKQ